MTSGGLGRAARPAGWARGYSLRLLVTDTVAVALAVVAAQLLRFGIDPGPGEGAMVNRDPNALVDYWWITAALFVVWIVALAAFGTRSERIVGIGTAEYARVASGTLAAFGAGAIALYLLNVDASRAYLLIALPLGLLLLVLTRWLWRRWLVRQRAVGAASYRVLVVGGYPSAAPIARSLLADAESGYLLVGVVAPGAPRGEVLPGTRIPLAHHLDDLDEMKTRSRADTIVVTGSEEVPPATMRALAWGLDPRREHLIVTPSVSDISGPRIHMRPVPGKPLVHVETPEFDGLARVGKRALDLVGGAVLLVLTLPLLLVLTLLAAIGGRGRPFASEERLGESGRPFRMLLLDGGKGSIGRFLERTGLRHLPQLITVIGGRMSLVGPRPAREADLAEAGRHLQRSFLVKPGLTGLGRPSVEFDEAIRLDLDYVEHWSVATDLVMLGKAVRAVFEGDRGRVPVRYLDVDVTPLTAEQIAEALTERTTRPTLVLNHNLHSVTYFHRMPEFAALYAKADTVVIDGWPVLRLAQIPGDTARTPLRAGSTDVIDALWGLPGAQRLAVYLLGGDAESNHAAQERFRARLPEARIGGRDGYFRDDDRADVVDELHSFSPDVVLVGMGMPRQELFLAELLDRLPAAHYVTVGGAIDYVAGAQRLAPRWIGRLGMEWTWRLLHDPKRLANRYLVEPILLARLLRRQRGMAKRSSTE